MLFLYIYLTRLVFFTGYVPKVLKMRGQWIRPPPWNWAKIWSFQTKFTCPRIVTCLEKIIIVNKFEILNKIYKIRFITCLQNTCTKESFTMKVRNPALKKWCLRNVISTHVQQDTLVLVLYGLTEAHESLNFSFTTIPYGAWLLRSIKCNV